jgi:hypothetical protein
VIASVVGWLLSQFLPGLLGNLADDVVAGLFSLLQGEIQRRNLIAQGRTEQHAADNDATVKEAQDAQTVSAQVDAEPISGVDADLERVRNSAAAGHG